MYLGVILGAWGLVAKFWRRSLNEIAYDEMVSVDRLLQVTYLYFVVKVFLTLYLFWNIFMEPIKGIYEGGTDQLVVHRYDITDCGTAKEEGK